MNAILDKGPQIPGCDGTEPSLRMLVHKYYEAHFSLAEANVLAMTYLKLVTPDPAQRQSDDERLAWRCAHEWRERTRAVELKLAAVRAAIT